jgi:hypothetical protein
MNANQKKLLDSIPVKKHDPDGITVKMITERVGGRYRAYRIFMEKLKTGEASSCWVKDGDRLVPGIKLKGK